MSVFGHGQVRLYVLAVLREGPRHGYDIIRELENRFSGLYAPSPGTVYPRLAKLEEEGLVERSEEGRKALYRLTDAGRAEVDARAPEIAELESSLDESADRLAEEMRRRVRAGAADLRSEISEATARLRRDTPGPEAASTTPTGPSGWAGTSAWGVTTDGSAPPPFDLDGMIGGLTRGHVPDADAIAAALRRWGFAAASARPDAAGPTVDVGDQGTGDAPTAPVDTADPSVPVPDAPDVRRADDPGPTVGTDGPAARVVSVDPGSPDGTTAGDEPPVEDVEVVLGEVVEEAAEEQSSPRTPPGAGFPTSAQVREVVAILKEAGERIQQVLDQPRR